MLKAMLEEFPELLGLTLAGVSSLMVSFLLQDFSQVASFLSELDFGVGLATLTAITLSLIWISEDL